MVNIEITGRRKELAILQEALESPDAEMVAVLGRRRVGKTYLVTQAYREHIVYELSGALDTDNSQQLENFRDQLNAASGQQLPIEAPDDWFSAFRMLRQYLQTLDLSRKKVLFFDELPWLAGHKSGFLEALGYFWNSWASRQNLVLVICGSAASWMIKKVVHHKGGLHNRITRLINLKPFTLGETEEFLHRRHVYADRFQILQLYMILGGIPHYLKELKPGKSIAQHIDRVCFSEGGLLRDEFFKLYPALFKNADKHIAVIRALAGKWKGMTRNEIIQYIGAASGGGLSTVIEELEQSGFISAWVPFGLRQQKKVYRLTDAYSLFHLHFLEPEFPVEEGTWLQVSQSQAYKSWCGYAFENVCMLHIAQIKKALGITGVYTKISTFYQKQTPELPGAQIDIVLDRKDHVINLFEIKFHEDPFLPDKSFAAGLRNKRMVFREVTGARKQLSWVLIAANGLKPNQHSTGLLDAALDANVLFEDP